MRRRAPGRGGGGRDGQVRDEVLRGVTSAHGTAGIETPTDVLQPEGSDSLEPALRSAQEEPG